MSKIWGKKSSITLIVTMVLMLTVIATIPVQAETPKARLTVVVKNPDGSLAPGTNVEVYDVGLVESGTTNKKGKFGTSLPRGNYHVVASKVGLKAEADVVLDGKTKLELTLEPVSPCVIVTVLHDGQPIPGATVEIFEVISTDFVWGGTTGTDGKVNVPCDAFDSYPIETEYFAAAHEYNENWHGFSSAFTTDKTGEPEQVTVNIG